MTEPTQEALDLASDLGPFTLQYLEQENYSGEHREWHETLTIPKGHALIAIIIIQAVLDDRVHSIRTDVFDVLRRHDVSEQCFAEVAAVTQAYLRGEYKEPKQ